jgi:hypothetical protein
MALYDDDGNIRVTVADGDSRGRYAPDGSFFVNVDSGNKGLYGPNGCLNVTEWNGEQSVYNPDGGMYVFNGTLVVGKTLNDGFGSPEWTYPGSDYTFERNSLAYYIDGSGNLVEAAVDEVRIDDDGNLILEDEKLMPVRNSWANGGSTTVLPTNWTQFTGGGLTFDPIGLETINGIQCFKFRIFGTATGTNGVSFRWEAVNNSAAVENDTVTTSAFLSITDGSLTGLTNFRFNITPYTNVGGSLTTAFGSNTNIKNNISSTLERYVFQHGTTGLNYAVMPATTAFYRGIFEIGYNNGAVVDATLCVGLPMDEHGTYPSTPFKTTGTAVTRAADLLTPSLPSGVHDFVVTHDDLSTTTIEDVEDPFTLDPATLSRPLVSSIDWRAV